MTLPECVHLSYVLCVVARKKRQWIKFNRFFLIGFIVNWNIWLWLTQVNISKKKTKQKIRGDVRDFWYCHWLAKRRQSSSSQWNWLKMDQIDGCDWRKMTEIVTQLKLLNIRNFSCVRLSLDGENYIIYIELAGGSWVCLGNKKN